MINLAQLRLATAVVYHMPGASMTLTGDGKEVFVGPTSETRTDLHPGDLRDLIHLCLRNKTLSSIYKGLNMQDGCEIAITIRPAPPLFESLGAGLYLVIPPTTRSIFCFPTLLLPEQVGKIVQDVSNNTLSCTLDYDEALDVTLASFERRLISEDRSERGGIIGEILAQCAIAEAGVEPCDPNQSDLSGL